MAIIGVQPVRQQQQSRQQQTSGMDKDIQRLLAGIQIANGVFGIGRAIEQREVAQLQQQKLAGEIEAAPRQQEMAFQQAELDLEQGEAALAQTQARTSLLEKQRELLESPPPPDPREAQKLDAQLKKAVNDAEVSRINKERSSSEWESQKASVESALATAPNQQLGRKVSGLQNLSAEQKKRADSVLMGLAGIRGMREGLGKSEFQVARPSSFVGDNEFTLGRSQFVEALGRLQSGGAITTDEESRFSNFAPGIGDVAFGDPARKLNQAESELLRRMQGFGWTPKDVDDYLGQSRRLPSSNAGAVQQPQSGAQPVGNLQRFRQLQGR